MNPAVIVVGAGGHARVVIDALQRAGTEILFATDADPAKHGQTMLGVRVAGGDEAIAAQVPGRVQLALGVGTVGHDRGRRAVAERLAALGHEFATVVHPSAVVASDVRVLEGAQIMAGAVVQTGTQIGRHAIINTGACVDHDCRVGDHAHVAPGATLSGGVDVGDGAFVGAGACVIQSVRVGAGSVVAAGAVVVRDVPAGACVMGVPARERTGERR
jgi:UDP-perosamine 4-acetyltransferase